jgi:hypothetical protein
VASAANSGGTVPAFALGISCGFSHDGGAVWCGGSPSFFRSERILDQPDVVSAVQRIRLAVPYFRYQQGVAHFPTLLDMLYSSDDRLVLDRPV